MPPFLCLGYCVGLSDDGRHFICDASRHFDFEGSGVSSVPPKSTKPISKPVAGLVHFLTGLGALCAFLATLAAIAQDWRQMFLWLSVALIIDGVDGPLARALQVGEHLKRFSGERLDLVIDYLTYVFVPVLALRIAGYLPDTWGLVLCAGILLSSLFHFSDLESKAESNHFVGFPAVWNIVAFYTFALEPSAVWLAGLVIMCIVFTFIPIKFVHPVRVEPLRPLTLGVTGLGCACLAWLLWSGFPAPLPVQVLLIGIAMYFVVRAAVPTAS